MIDTGAVKSFVSKNIITELELDVSNYGTMTDASNTSKPVNLYICSILLENHQKSIKLEVAGFIGRRECDMMGWI